MHSAEIEVSDEDEDDVAGESDYSYSYNYDPSFYSFDPENYGDYFDGFGKIQKFYFTLL